MTATAVLFPGLNAIFRSRDRHRFDELPQVKINFTRLQDFGFAEDINIASEELMARSRYASVAALSLAIQCGVYRELLQRGMQPKILVGCSLGDVARSICSDALTFDDALGILAALREPLARLAPTGKTVAIRLCGANRINSATIEQLETAGFEASILSARHMTVGCDEQRYEALVNICTESGWELNDTGVPFALHSSHMLSTVNSFSSQFQLAPRQMSTPVFSSVQLKRLDCWEDVIIDGLKVFSSPIQWPRTLALLRSEQGISRFINIGPCNSLTLLARETDRSFRIEPAWQHLTQ